MTLPWFLSPWAEVRRLRGREALASTSFDARFADYQKAQFHASSLESENADLKRKVGELHAYCSCLEGKGVVRPILPSSDDLIQSLERNAKRQMTSEEIEIQRQNYARSFGKAEL